jgi:hypothetical protein
VRTERVPPTLVYNLSLDRDNAYYANDILVFNSQTFASKIGPRRSDRAERLGGRRSRFRSDYNPYAIDESEILR